MKNLLKYFLGVFILGVLCGNFIVLFSNNDTGAVKCEEITSEEPSEGDANRGKVKLIVAKGRY
ncbi:MAG: hypothetical protein KJO05_02100 [Bacteroidia bacterium]|nr:hypothetical protein [Bacteroidia bacterium]NNF29945.1 hypothetical protein [Flavobacteriaceae bacterium]MBT8276075.1 hypothetical protein [Bacteroidia bacterium]NNJ82466.1 hypothetical protein [Flavobacteriaceae bacterium]NNK53650.1 hypothetical protein [Flavobacteriaceae bacterium]